MFVLKAVSSTFRLLGAPAGIDVDGDHRLGGVDDQVAAGFQIHPVLVDDADLILELVFVEEGGLLLVQLDHLDVPGGDGLAVGPHLPEGFHVVDQDLLDVRA